MSGGLNRCRLYSPQLATTVACYDCSLLRMSSFRRMPESSGLFVDTGLRQCDVMLLIPDRLRRESLLIERSDEREIEKEG
jgi:hypothetical protein